MQQYDFISYSIEFLNHKLCLFLLYNTIFLALKRLYLILNIHTAMTSIDQKNVFLNIQINESQQIPPEVLQHLSHIEHHTVHLSSLIWRQLNMNHHALKIKSWEVADRLNLSNNKQPRLISTISNISFPSLKYLNLQYNLISSLEPLTSIWMPMLQNINLSGNCITHIHSLRRCYFPQLKALFFNSNRIVEFRGMAEIDGKCLREIVVEKDSLSKLQGQDPSWFMKLQPFGIFESFSIKSNSRIKMKNLPRRVQKKYPYIHQ